MERCEELFSSAHCATREGRPQSASVSGNPVYRPEAPTTQQRRPSVNLNGLLADSGNQRPNPWAPIIGRFSASRRLVASFGYASIAARVPCLRMRFHLFPKRVNVFTGSHQQIYRPNKECAKDSHDEEPCEAFEEYKARA